MLSDARKLRQNSTIVGDVCVVGAGPAGLTVARKLAGARVVLLESGGLVPDADTQSLAEGQVVGDLYWALQTSRLRCFGGSSQHWTGWCRPLDPLDFEVRPWLEQSGWSISRDELIPYYEQAQGICDLGPFDYDPEVWAKRLGLALLPLENTVARTSLWQFSRPTRFGEKYLAEIRDSAGIDAYLYANAVKLETSIDGKRIQALSVRCLDGSGFTVRAQHFVIACGGIENARLLLASGAPRGLGNGSGLLGRYFLEHPHAAVGILRCASSLGSLDLYERVCSVPGGNPAAIRATLSLTPEVQRRERILNFSVGLEPLTRTPPFDSSRAESTLSLARRLQGIDGQRSLELFVRAEQYPSPDSRIFLGGDVDRLDMPRVSLAWKHHPLTLASMRRGVELIAEALGRARVGRVYSYIHGQAAPSPGTWPEIWGGHHHMGTTRMHEDPRFGIVDRHCRVHALDNLYIAGSSVFPTAGYANPTLTLVALAARLADTLKARL